MFRIKCIPVFSLKMNDFLSTVFAQCKEGGLKPYMNTPLPEAI